MKRFQWIGLFSFFSIAIFSCSAVTQENLVFEAETALLLGEAGKIQDGSASGKYLVNQPSLAIAGSFLQ